MARHVCPECGQEVEEAEEEREERAGPWKSGYGEYPMADEIYDLTHEREPDPGDPYDDYDNRDYDPDESEESL